MTVPGLLPAPCGWTGTSGELVSSWAPNFTRREQPDVDSNIAFLGWACPRCRRILRITPDRAMINHDLTERVACQKETA